MFDFLADYLFTKEEHPTMENFNARLEMLNALKNYWWKRAKIVYREDQAFSSSEYNLATGSVGNITYADSISISQEDGTITLISPKTLSAWGALDLYVLRNKYCIPTDGNTPRDAVVYLHSNVIIDKYSSYIAIRNYSTVTAVLGPSYDIEYIQSSDRSAYPDSGEQDGYEYQYLGIPFENAVNTPKIEMGSYLGTGTSGSSNPNSLTFSFKPKIVFIFGVGTGTPATPVAIFPTFSWRTDGAYEAAAYITCSSSCSVISDSYAKLQGNTMFWYSVNGSNDVWDQMNSGRANVFYSYVAIG